MKTIFKIIPMINPDGVVVGNFRTSLAGKDLNRVFKTNQDILYPEVKALKNLVNKLKN
jgi:murein tripeptide amidase MpaA